MRERERESIKEELPEWCEGKKLRERERDL